MTEHSLEDYRMLIGRRVQRARTLSRMSLPALARQAGLTAARLRSIESGLESLTVDELERIAAALRIPLPHFLGPCILCGSPE